VALRRTLGKAWSARQVDPEGWCASCKIDKPEDACRNNTATARHIGLLVRSALPEELNSMAAGEDVKETVMTIPFLRTCIINMIVDLEKRFILVGNKWFTSYELGSPMVSDEHDRPMHSLVETFVDDQLEAHWAKEEEANAPLPPPISQLQTLKDGWGDQTSDELPPTIYRATSRERFSTSHIARNPLKLPEIELDVEDFLSMIKNPPAVGTVRIHMDPESLDTSFGGSTASTFQGVATLITPAGPFRMEGARWHLLSQVFSSPEDIKTRIDLHKERLLQETMDKDPSCRSFA